MAGELHQLLPPTWEKHIDFWLNEDLPSFDYGGFVVGSKQETAFLLGKSSGLLAGCPFFEKIFSRLNCKVTWHLSEGSFVDAKQKTTKVHVATVTGAARDILMGERTALNVLSRASGIATLARSVVTTARNAGYKGFVSGTRKTTPGFRIVEKYALMVGGADTHRHDLSSMIMLKDNHVWSCGSITRAVEKAKSVGGFSLKIEVECQSQEDAEEAINAGADVVMLDNFDPEKLKQTAKNLKERFPKILIEASGGITPQTISQYACDHVDIISMGNLTQGVPNIDFSLKIQVKK